MYDTKSRTVKTKINYYILLLKAKIFYVENFFHKFRHAVERKIINSNDSRLTVDVYIYLRELINACYKYLQPIRKTGSDT